MPVLLFYYNRADLLTDPKIIWRENTKQAKIEEIIMAVIYLFRFNRTMTIFHPKFACIYYVMNNMPLAKYYTDRLNTRVFYNLKHT